jgi:hypothetical protein
VYRKQKTASQRRPLSVVCFLLSLDILGRHRVRPTVHVVQAPLDRINNGRENVLPTQLVGQAALDHPVGHFHARVADAQLRLQTLLRRVHVLEHVQTGGIDPRGRAHIQNDKLDRHVRIGLLHFFFRPTLVFANLIPHSGGVGKINGSVDADNDHAIVPFRI